MPKIKLNRERGQMTVGEAAEYVGLSMSAAYKLVAAGEFPVHVRRGTTGGYVVVRKELDEWLEAGGLFADEEVPHAC